MSNGSPTQFLAKGEVQIQSLGSLYVVRYRSWTDAREERRFDPSKDPDARDKANAQMDVWIAESLRQQRELGLIEK